MRSLHSLVAPLDKAGQLVAAPQEDPLITAVTDDSREVVVGSLFCAVEGTARDGHQFVRAAADAGAAAAIVARPVDAGIPCVQVRESRTAVSIVASEWFERPADSLEIVGVTGTNGKTTTVALLRHLLGAEGTAGSVGTLGALDGSGHVLSGSGGLTTPGAIELHGVLAGLCQRGVRTVVMEASSHALDQRRLDRVRFRAAVYTNLTQDHLDYHPTIEEYRDAKLRLSELLRTDGIEIVNADETAWHALPRRPDRPRLTFAQITRADVCAIDASLRADGFAATLLFQGEPHRVTVPLLGGFNIANALAAAAAAWALGLHPRAIAERLATVPAVPGRFEVLARGPSIVLRDYCHTPDALERALEALRQITAGRLIVVFGAGGDRDRGKRPLMGRAVAQRADVAIVTSDNPRTEDPDRIIDEIEAGMEGTAHVRLSDRREAIRYAVAMLQSGDCLLLAGKGHEDYQIIGTERYPFDERAIVRDLLHQRSTP